MPCPKIGINISLLGDKLRAVDILRDRVQVAAHSDQQLHSQREPLSDTV